MSQASTIAPHSSLLVVSALGVGQILAWGYTYYLPAVLALPIAQATGWPLAWLFGALSLGLVVSGLVSPRVGRLIHQRGGRRVLAASAVLIGLGLLKSRREGRVVFYAVELAGIRDLIGFLAEDCCAAAPGVCAPLLGAALPLPTCPAPAGCQPGDPA